MAGFRDLTERLEQLKKIPSRVATSVAVRIGELLLAQFESSTNAYGNPWRPLLPQTVRRKGGDSRILRQTDVLSASPEVRATSGSGIQIRIDDVGRFHQGGTKYMVARKILPDGSALPTTWSSAIRDALAESAK